VVTTEEQRFGVRFYEQEGPYAKDVYKETFPVYGGKCLSRGAVHKWVEKFSQGRYEVAVDTRSSAELAETTVEKTSMLRFRHTDKAMGQVYQCWLKVLISHALRFIYICDLFTDCPSW
jgi:hypothetical protein